MAGQFPRPPGYPLPGGDEEDVDEPEGMEGIEMPGSQNNQNPEQQQQQSDHPERIPGADNRPQSPEIPIDPNLKPMFSPRHYRQPQQQQQQQKQQQTGQHAGIYDPDDPQGLYGEDNDPHPQPGQQVGEPLAVHGYRGLYHHGTLEQYQYTLKHFMDPETFGTKHDAPGGAPPSEPAEPSSAIDPDAPTTSTGGGAGTQKKRPPRSYNRRPKPTDRPFKGELADHPEWWGSYIDDGPQKPGEDMRTAAKRITRARENMQIEMRPSTPLLPPVVIDITANRHRAKLDPANEEYDSDYVARWRAEKEARKKRNDDRRREELTFVSLEYIRNELMPPQL